MNGIHDMGGMQDMGPIQVEKDEPLFHAPWEGRMCAMFSAVRFPWPVRRAQIEAIPPADYLRMSYYEKWLAALGPLMTKAGMVTAAEIESGKSIGAPTKNWHALSVVEVGTFFALPPNTGPKPAAARFEVGQGIRARNVNPVGHTRLPRYARGKLGTIARIYSVQSFDDAVAQGLADKPQHVYSVRFTARELWGEQGNQRDSVYVDMWEDHLEPA